jgi:hypothetical protein
MDRLAPYRMLPPNCPLIWGTTEKCHKCGQFHLRPGYCQALTVDSLVDVTPVTEPVTPPVTRNADVTPERNANADRQARYRARKRAEAGAL